MRDRQDTDLTRGHPRPRRRKAIHCSGDGAATFGGEVGAGSISHVTWDTGVLDRRFAEWRRREKVTRRERSAYSARPHRARGVTYNVERTPTTERMDQFTQA